MKKESLNRKIEEFAELLDELGISEIFLKEGSDYIRIKKRGAILKERKQDYQIEKNHPYKEIIAPISGRFYRSQRQECPPYVEIGGIIEKGATICLIEAMKIFNEIKGEFRAKVVQVLPKDGQMVKSGDILFLVEPLE